MSWVRPLALISLMRGLGQEKPRVSGRGGEQDGGGKDDEEAGGAEGELPAPPAQLSPQEDARRNICILAHVDHGKTTLSDSLLASNGIISSKLAGKVRYLDSRPDEQERGITMEASAISLLFRVRLRSAGSREAETQQPQGPAPGNGFGCKASGASGAVSEVEQSYLVNVIDSPGHVDFSSEVYTASRLCDGALVLVDAVEGVCTQTHTVLRQAWVEGVVPVLVINKIDRLVTELRLTPAEAYDQLRKIMEAVNAVVGSMWTGQRMEEDELRRKRAAKNTSQAESVEVNVENADLTPLSSALYEQWTLSDADDEDLYFSPEKGNVVFASALDGWAFRIDDFANLYANKLGISEKLLTRCLWGDYYLDTKTKKVVTWKGLKGRNLKPMFVQFVLDNVWKVYEAVMIEGDKQKVEKIVSALSLKVLPRELKSKDSRALLSTIMSQWMPLAPAVLRTVVEHLPSPTAAQRLRLPRLLHPSNSLRSSTTTEPENDVEKALYECDQRADAPCVAYVSKVFSVPEEHLPENRRKQLSADELRQRGREVRAQRLLSQQSVEGAGKAEGAHPQPELSPGCASLSTSASPVRPADTAGSEASAASAPSSCQQQQQQLLPPQQPRQKHMERLVGFARLYSGTLRLGMRLGVLGPKYNPAHPGRFRSEMVVEDLYLVMGTDLERLDNVPAGCVFGIGLRPGNGDGLVKSGTLCNVEGFPSLGRVALEAAPTVRVCVEPKDPADVPLLEEGLRLLNQADPAVQVLIQGTGEHVILAAGELHLERCLRDLREKFARVEIQVSPPIVPFRETVVRPPLDTPLCKDSPSPGSVVLKSSGQRPVTIRVRAVPLPGNVTDFLLRHTLTIKSLIEERGGRRAAELRDMDIADSLIQDGATANAQGRMSVKRMSLDQFLGELQREFAMVTDEDAEVWQGAVDRIWAFGSRRIGPNMLVNAIQGYKRRTWIRQPTKNRQDLLADESGSPRPSTPEVDDDDSTVASGSQFGGAGREDHPISEFDEAINTAFQLATGAGPLCAEAMMGVGYIVEDFFIDPSTPTVATSSAAVAAEDDAEAEESSAEREEQARNGQTGRGAPLAGQVISLAKEAFRQSFMSLSPRLMLAMYTCDIQAQVEVLGKVYAVLAKRKGKVLSEDMKEGTSWWMIKAKLPVVESFGFADDIRKRTSGGAIPQLVMSGFETLDQDPYWVPTTEEELEDLGEKADRENIAKKYMEAVRKRKGMFLEKKIVAHAEKQRTLRK